MYSVAPLPANVEAMLPGNVEAIKRQLAPRMRGEFVDQGKLFSYISPETRVPANEGRDDDVSSAFESLCNSLVKFIDRWTQLLPDAAVSRLRCHFRCGTARLSRTR